MTSSYRNDPNRDLKNHISSVLSQYYWKNDTITYYQSMGYIFDKIEDIIYQKEGEMCQIYMKNGKICSEDDHDFTLLIGSKENKAFQAVTMLQFPDVEAWRASNTNFFVRNINANNNFVKTCYGIDFVFSHECHAIILNIIDGEWKF